MAKLRRKNRFIHQIPGQVYLWLAVLIFGASSAITRKLTEIGAENFLGGRNPISLCNVLFVGNLCALFLMIFIYGRQWNQTALQKITRKDWLYLIVVAILAGALAPGLIFQSLALTNVNNVILIGRIEVPLTLFLSIVVLKERVNRGEIIGAIAAFIGVLITILIQPQSDEIRMNMAGLNIGLGELLAATGAIFLSLATVISKQHLIDIPLGIYSIFRTALGTVVFFMIALVLYGSHHFMDVFSPFLWKWMLIYGGLIVVVGQSFWIKGLRVASVSTASLASSFTPVAGIVAAYLILGEAPTPAQYFGSGLILIGILISQISLRRQNSARLMVNQEVSTAKEQEIENKAGFKGV
ncbi:DMT family transporter [Nostoc sp. CMAA1605]|uniref:DMT family transporter n=1 Tax=Nostoc sp. CMAA1605 TaxID=2055159 RepID=UPI001F3D17F9|nr:DMT family transporter [Nostoc sp. CMAA1605]MCF4967730.1 EamA family transporter [Nostoc sp. CMAA1605]